MTYNLSNFTGANDFLSMTIASDQLVGGYLMVLILLLVFAISFIAMKNYELKHALVTSSVITFVLAVSLWGAGVVGERALVIVVVVMLASLLLAVIAD